MTDQRVTISVPSPSPETSLSMGKEWSGTDWNSAGLCVNTDGRVWLDACGESSSSTFSAISNGGDGIGQMLMQSLSADLYVMAEEDTIVSANGSILVAGATGVKIVAGHGRAIELGPVTYGDASLERVAPDDTSPSSSAAAAYVDHLKAVEDGWSFAVAALAPLLTVPEICRAILGVRGVGSAASTVNALTTLTAISSLTGGFTQLGKGLGGDVPGLNLHSVWDVNFATTGFATFYSLAGLTMTGGNANTVGLVEASVLAGAGASLRAGYTAAVEGNALEVTAGKDITVASLADVLKMYGATIILGAKLAGGGALTQFPTISVDVAAVKTLELEANMGSLEVSSGGSVEYAGDTVEVDAIQEIVIQGLGYTVKVSVAGIDIVGAGGNMSVSAAGVVVEGGAAKLAVTDGILIDAGSQIGADTSGSWFIKAPQMAIV